MNKELFDAGWEISEAQGMAAALFAQWQPVMLPHDASISRPRSQQHSTGGGGGFAWSGVITYRKKFHAPEGWQGRSVQMEFEGAYMNAKVSVNGSVAAFHPYGYTSFLVEIQPYLKYGAENEVSVVVNNSAQPNSRWYTGTGLYRHVWLRLGGAVHIAPWGIFVTTPKVSSAEAKVKVSTELANDAAAPIKVVLRTTVLEAGGKQVGQVETALQVPAEGILNTEQELSLAAARLWSLEDPYLYTLTSEVLAEDQVLDAEMTTFGIRSISVDPQQGFRLNGVPMKLKGGCVHHDNGLLGAASYDRAEERKIELMKAAGFNAIRCAHNPPAPAMLEACDRLGMLVIDETFDCWRMGKNPNDYHLWFDDWWQRDTEAMVKRDRNHPSIIMWSIGNEVPERTGVSDGYAWCRKQAAFVRLLDNTRLVISAVPALFEEMMANPEVDLAKLENLWDWMNGTPTDSKKDRWGIVTRPFFIPLDVGGYNYLNNRYAFDSQQFQERVICGTETWPHQVFAFWQSTESLPNVIGDFVWTALDYLGESGIGKVTFDAPGGLFFAQDPWPYHLANCGDIDICGFKRPQSYYRDILWGVRQEPFIAVHNPQNYEKKASFNPWGWEPVSDNWTFPGCEGQPTRVEVYSADEEVELLINGVSTGRKPAGTAQKNKAVFEVIYQPGKIEAVGYSQGKETGRAFLVSASAPAALRLTADRMAIQSAFGDLAYITVEVVDAKGVANKASELEVSLDVSGAGELIAVGTANPVSEELYVGSKRKAFEGRLMAVVRSTGQAGEITVKASAEGLAGAETRITAG